jgi:hypothetical protein
VLFALAALAPVMLMFGFAALARRLADLRQSAASIAHVAVRLAEPESMANEQFTSLAQAIRREVTTLGDGVEKAFSRANELDSLVRTEISALERSAGEHERRLRALIAELADQRDAIHAKGLAVSDAITAAHSDAARELGTLGEALARRAKELNESTDSALASVSERFAETVERASQSGVARLDGVGQEVARVLSESAEANAQQVLDAASRLDIGFKSRGEEFVGELGRRHEEIGHNFSTSAERVVSAIRSEGLGVVVQLETAAAATHEAISLSGSEIANQIAASGEHMVEAIRTHGEAVAARLTDSGARLAEDFDGHGERLASRLEQSGLGAMETLRSATRRCRAASTSARAISSIRCNAPARRRWRRSTPEPTKPPRGSSRRMTTSRWISTCASPR